MDTFATGTVLCTSGNPVNHREFRQSSWRTGGKKGKPDDIFSTKHETTRQTVRMDGCIPVLRGRIVPEAKD